MSGDLRSHGAAFCLGIVVAALALGATAPPPPDLELVDRTLTMAEQCTSVTHTTLRALLYRAGDSTRVSAGP